MMRLLHFCLFFSVLVFGLFAKSAPAQAESAQSEAEISPVESFVPPLLTIDRCTTADENILPYLQGGANQFCFQGKSLIILYKAHDQMVYSATLTEDQSVMAIASGDCDGQPCQFKLFSKDELLVFGLKDRGTESNTLAHHSDGNTIEQWRIAEIHQPDLLYVYDYGALDSEEVTVRAYQRAASSTLSVDEQPSLREPTESDSDLSRPSTPSLDHLLDDYTTDPENFPSF